MQKIFSTTLSLLLLGSFSSSAQNEFDALRYGQLSVGGTALSMSMGGAGGSMGGDFSSLAVNPAGIGVYRSSELTFTPSLRINNANGQYQGSEVSEGNSKFNIANFGLVITKSASGRRYKNSDWKSVSFGIGYNRLADFNQRTFFSGVNNQSSMGEVFSDYANATGIEDNVVPPFGYLGYYGFLLDESLGSIVPYADGLQQSKSMRTSGGIGEWVLSLGGNYREKLLLGATLGLQSHRFDRDINYTEEDVSGKNNNNFAYLSYNDYLTTTGVGVNLKLGAIYVVNDVLKIGAAAHTPTWSAFTDISDYNITTNTETYKFDNGYQDTDPESFVQPEAVSNFSYSMRSPWKGILSTTLTLGKNGMLTADYEFVDYASMRYNMGADNSDYAAEVNDKIKNTFKGGHNLRMGAEGRVDNFMGRLGFAYYSSPFQDSELFDGQRMNLSAGLGARFGAFFMDLAYVHSIYKVGEPVYQYSSWGPVASIRNAQNIVALTLGFKWR